MYPKKYQKQLPFLIENPSSKQLHHKHLPAFLHRHFVYDDDDCGDSEFDNEYGDEVYSTDDDAGHSDLGNEEINSNQEQEEDGTINDDDL